MGNLDDMTAHIIMVTLLNEFCIDIPEINLQTITAVCRNPFKISLSELYDTIPSDKRHYEPELFPAMQITKFTPVHVNIFTSGCVVILGLKTLESGKLILNELMPYILSAIYENADSGNQK